jgi:hypothetical protein
VAAQARRQNFADRRVVLDQEDATGHLAILAPERAVSQSAVGCPVGFPLCDRSTPQPSSRPMGGSVSPRSA